MIIISKCNAWDFGMENKLFWAWRNTKKCLFAYASIMNSHLQFKTWWVIWHGNWHISYWWNSSNSWHKNMKIQENSWMFSWIPSKEDKWPLCLLRNQKVPHVHQMGLVNHWTLIEFSTIHNLPLWTGLQSLQTKTCYGHIHQAWPRLEIFLNFLIPNFLHNKCWKLRSWESAFSHNQTLANAVWHAIIHLYLLYFDTFFVFKKKFINSPLTFSDGWNPDPCQSILMVFHMHCFIQASMCGWPDNP